MLERLVVEGMNVARLNFSHGSHPEFVKIISSIREIEKRLRKPVGILADVQGPKIRVGKLVGASLELVTGEEVWISTESAPGGSRDGRKVISTVYRDFVKDVPPGARVLLDDGLMELEVEGKSGGMLCCRVLNGGTLKENKGINVPEATFSTPSITEKDYEDILFALDQGVDFIALSFVRSPQEVRHLSSFIASRGKRTQVIAKIEKREALDSLEQIIDVSDGILVARGDLAVEVGSERVPVLQKKIVRRCNLKGKSVIIATQMLMSMVDSPRPTRAEASDVANAIEDDTDAIMLSNETAIGKYPIEALKMMDRIVTEMEQVPRGQRILYNEWELPRDGQSAMALLQSAVRLASIVQAKAMVVVTQSGRSPLLVSKCRPNTPVIGITGSLESYRLLSLQWGISGLFMPDLDSLIKQTSVFDAIGQRLLAAGAVNTGDTIVVTAGLPALAHGSTNTIKVHAI